jgi:hypothetical protein
MEIMLAEMRIAEDAIRQRRRGSVYRKPLIYGLPHYPAGSGFFSEIPVPESGIRASRANF